MHGSRTRSGVSQGGQVDLTPVRELLREQDGLLSRRQALAAGLTDRDLARLVRRRELVRVHTGVYVDHTGELSWVQRAWAAVLFSWPAALCAESALVACGIRSATRDLEPGSRRRGAGGPLIHVAVDARRRVTEPPGVRVHRVTDLSSRVQPNVRPFRLRLETALVQVASAARDETAAIAILADACQERRTTPGRLLDALTAHPNLPRRRFLLDVLEDVATGTYSVLEHRYLTQVERPHALPTARRQRQVRLGRTAAYRDVEYVQVGAVVELDGRLGHELAADRWADLTRDVDALLAGDSTMRLGWGHVLDPCRTALVVGQFLGALGWEGDPAPCGPDCAVARPDLCLPGYGESPSRGA